MAELTRGLTNLRNQVNTRFPNRDKTTDGTKGDDAHKARTSGHNLDDTEGSKPAWDGDSDSKPEVRAWDQDADLGEPGVTAQMEVDHIRKLPGVERVLRYIIYDGLIYHSRDDFRPAEYDGANKHTKHIHYEGAWTDTGDANDDFDFQLDKLGDSTVSAQDVINFLKSAEGKTTIYAAVNQDRVQAYDTNPNTLAQKTRKATAADNGFMTPASAHAFTVKNTDLIKVLGLKVDDKIDDILVLLKAIAATINAQGTQDDAEVAAVLAKLGAVLEKVDEQTDKTIEGVLSGLGTSQSVEEAAEMLRAIYGDRATAIGQLLAA